MAVTVIPNVTNWTVAPQNGQAGYFTLMNTWLGQSTSVIASLQTAITAQNTANSEINALAIQVANDAIVATGLANYQGIWSNSITYSKGQSVSASGLYYISKIDSNLNHLVTDTNYWLYNPINDKINKVTTPTINALAKIQADGTLKNSSVIEGTAGNILIGTSTDNGIDMLQINGSISSIPRALGSPSSNWIDSAQSGLYNIYGNTGQQMPLALDYHYTVQVVTYNNNSNPIGKSILAIRLDTGDVYVKSKLGTVWTNWSLK